MGVVVKLNEVTKGKLDTLKEHPRETYDDIINRLMAQHNSKNLVANESIAKGALLDGHTTTAETDRGISARLLPILQKTSLYYDLKKGEAITFGYLNWQHVDLSLYDLSGGEQPEASIIIRAKNEEQWLERCLAAIAHQDHPNFEVILVDNESTDATVEIAKKFKCNVITITNEEFTFSKSLNKGIKAARGKHIAIISGHCIPTHDRWLSQLTADLNDPETAGVYGRQEPLPDTDPNDKRDLWTTFGIEKRIQRKDYFFHNANSAIKKSLWEEVPFDETINGVEDRQWAKEMIKKGKTVVYNPDASVYHWHGIHHNGSKDRAERVAKVIELIQEEY